MDIFIRWPQALTVKKFIPFHNDSTNKIFCEAANLLQSYYRETVRPVAHIQTIELSWLGSFSTIFTSKSQEYLNQETIQQ